VEGWNVGDVWCVRAGVRKPLAGERWRAARFRWPSSKGKEKKKKRKSHLVRRAFRHDFPGHRFHDQVRRFSRLHLHGVHARRIGDGVVSEAQHGLGAGVAVAVAGGGGRCCCFSCGGGLAAHGGQAGAAGGRVLGARHVFLMGVCAWSAPPSLCVRKEKKSVEKFSSSQHRKKARGFLRTAPAPFHRDPRCAAARLA
jgi:hypothetical protein